MTATWRRWILAAVLGSLVAGCASARRLLTPDGAVAAAAVGTLVFGRGGVRASAALLTFFVSSSALSRVGQARKRRAAVAQAKGAQRDAWQVLANGGIAAACMALGAGDAFVGALAAAAADTWATELGMLATSRPRLITTLRPVPRGTSGGVTLEGLAASAAGAAAVGVAWGSIGRAMLAGLSGSLFDSLLGATLQARYACTTCGATVEEPRHVACDAAARHIAGYPWATNDTVNAAATLAGAAIAALLQPASERNRIHTGRLPVRA